MTAPPNEESVTSMLPTVEAAKQLADRGFHVFALDHPTHPRCIGLHGPGNPCDKQRGKHPVTKWGTASSWWPWFATNTHTAIDTTWETNGGYCNIGISCGPNNLVVIDEDKYGELERWCVTYGIELPDTYTITTGRGHHYVFSWDHTVQRISDSDKAFEGFKINVRADGGYIVGEGSQHANGATYTGNGLPVVPLPEQVAAIFLAGTQDNHQAAETHGGAAEFLTPSRDPNTTKIVDGQRHNQLVKYAGRLRHLGLDHAEALPVYRQRWLLCEQPEGLIPEAQFHSPTCRHPVTWEEAQAKLASVYNSYPPGEDAETPTPSKTSRRVLQWRTAADVTDGVPEWAWEYDGHGAMMRNTLALFAGRPEAGKSTAARWFAAGYTNGTIAGCFEGKRQHVAYIAAEESIEYMVKPSLRAVGADMSRVHFPHIEMDGQQVQMLSSRDEDIITDGLIALGITVVVIDPIMAGISGQVDINRNNEVRLAVQPWARIADRINGLGLGIVHLKKAPGGDVVAAINGSSAFGEIARAIIAFAPDGESDDGTHIMSQVKNSAGPGKPSITYTIENTRVETDGGTAYVGRFVMGDRADRTVSDVLSQSAARAKMGPRMLEVLAACTAAPASIPITPRYIADVVPDLTSKDAAKYLSRAVKHELLVQRMRGVYGLPGS